LRPYKQTPRRKVPGHIKKPDYADDLEGRSPSEEKEKYSKYIPVYSEEEINGIRESCKLARKILDEAHKIVKAGVRTDEIDKLVHELTIENDAYPSPLNYYKFPKSVCT
jgi:methionyl aminopeptidase